MLLHGNENRATRGPVPAEMFAKLTLSQAPLSPKIPKVVARIGTFIIGGAVITYLATGSLELLFGIGFWGLWVMLSRLYPSK